MSKYILQENESVIMKNKGVKHVGGAKTNELILTNLNLIVVKKGIFGNTESVQYFPVNQIIKAIATLKTKTKKKKIPYEDHYSLFPKYEYHEKVLESTLTVRLANSIEYFSFGKTPAWKADPNEWAGNINELLEGELTEINPTSIKAIPGAEYMAEKARDTANALKNPFGEKGYTEIKKSMSWGWIIFLLIIFWPVGLLFLFKKIKSDKATVIKDSKTIRIMSYVLMGLGVFSIYTALTSNAETILSAFFFGIGGVVLNIYARKMKTQSHEFTSDNQVSESVVTCGNCGANNRILIGQTGECEHCGSPMQ